MNCEIENIALHRVIKTVQKMWKSRDELWTQEKIPIKRGLYFSVEIERYGEEDCPVDDDGNVVYDFSPPPGTPLSLEIYAVKNGEWIDCCTVQPPEMENLENDVKYLLKCYG